MESEKRLWEDYRNHKCWFFGVRFEHFDTVGTMEHEIIIYYKNGQTRTYNTQLGMIGARVIIYFEFFKNLVAKIVKRD